MKSIKHRLLSLLLTLVTVLSLLPTAAFAASNTGSGLKITTNQAYWSTRLLANGTSYSYRPPLVDGKLVYCMDSGLGYHYATPSYLNSFTWTSGTGADADAVLQSAVTNSGLSEMDAATVENVKWMMTYLNDCKASNVGQLFMAVQTYVWDHQSYKGEPGGDGDAGGYVNPVPRCQPENAGLPLPVWWLNDRLCKGNSDRHRRDLMKRAGRYCLAADLPAPLWEVIFIWITTGS